MKLAIFVVAIVLLLWLVFGRRGRRDDTRPRRPPAAEAEGMVVCAHCGVHLPRSEAVADGARLYCTDAHRLAGSREPPSR
jgi:uncharacterized protein